jgi:exodeoxyribonuclease VII large subunit
MTDALSIQTGSWARLSSWAAEVRRAVFVVEQGIPESEEWDDIDHEAVHFVALLDGEAVGCARLTRDAKVGRMAVLAPWRGQGIGKRIVQTCIEFAVSRQFTELRLSAQSHAISFYEKQGFLPQGEPHVEVGIAHQWMSLQIDDAPACVPLLQYLQRVEEHVDDLPAFWVNASLSELKRQSSGHVYLTLVQSDESGAVVAKARAIIWRGQAASIESRFRKATGQDLADNQDVMVQVKAQAHPAHGLSVVVKDIYPEFTLGRLQARLEQIRQQLRTAGLIQRNRQLGLPEDYFRVAVLSPDSAAGLGDFRSRADALAALGLLQFVYFTAVFQGVQAATSVSGALGQIARDHAEQAFDAVVIIRGGGSQWDLASLNEWAIARQVCLMPMPVICGIGHERDSTIIDEIACKRLPTPSMVIDFVEQVVMDRVRRVINNMAEIRRLALQRIQTADLQIQALDAQIESRARAAVASSFARLQALRHAVDTSARKQHAQASAQTQALLWARVEPVLRQQLQRANEQVDRLRFVDVAHVARHRLETAQLRLQLHRDYVAAQDPALVLQRGYAMVLDPQGRPVMRAVNARWHDTLVLKFRDDSVAVQPLKEDHDPTK